jgi:tetratricopeptide (TPR) repeat protein
MPCSRAAKSLTKARVSRPRLIALLLALVTLVVYLPASRFSFVNYDDDDYVTSNGVVKRGLTWAGVRWAFTTFHASNWHPLTWLSHMTDCELFRLNAGGHHFVNVLLHAANAALVFALLLRLSKTIWPSAFAAALFAWHPVHVESVAWVAERKDVLSTFFALLTLLCYVRRDECCVMREGDNSRVTRHASRYYWLALFFFALGLLAKPMLVTLPFVLLLLDCWPLGRISDFRFQISNHSRLVVEKIPFFLLTGMLCVVTVLAQRKGEAFVSLASVPLLHRFENSFVAVAGYLQSFFWPSGLCALYPLVDKNPAWKVFLSALIVLVISVVAWRARGTKPYLLMGWLWFVGMLVPVIGLVQVGGQALADRYTYLPSVGFFLALVLLARDVAEKIALPKIIAVGGAALVCVACIRATELQMQFWRDGETLFRRVIAVTRDNTVAYVDLGVALDAQGRFEEAVEVYRQAKKISPKYFQTENNLGNILGILGRHEESLVEYREAIRLRPDMAFAHHGAGQQLAALGKPDDALREFAEAARLDANFAEPHLEAAKVLFALGREAGGISELREAVRLHPEDYPTLATAAHYLAANKNDAVRDAPNALLLAIKANEISGHHQPMVFDILGMALAANGDFTNAAICAQNALELANAAQMKNTVQLQQRLELYQKNLPWRESFRATNAP